MNEIFSFLFSPASPYITDLMVCIMRMGIGILTIGHGIPKLLGGIPVWQSIGQFTGSIGIHWLPTMWGFLGACTETFGGLALVLGLGTRLACGPLTFMMIVATAMHIDKGDSFNVYSFPLSLIVVYSCYMIIGSGTFSLDYLLMRV